MIVRYWHPLREAETLRRQFDQLLDEFAQATDLVQTTWTPAIAIANQENAFVLKVQLPGVDHADIDIQVTRDTVAISGERKAPAEKEASSILRSEFRYGTFRRVVNLPEAVQNTEAQAQFEHGILTLTLPKVDDAKTKVVKVTLKGSTSSDESQVGPVIESEAAA